MSQYNFEQFTKTGSKSGNYSISFNGKSNTFGFNSGFYIKENIKQYKKAILFYDKEKKAVAFKFTNDEKALGAFTIIHGKTQSTGSLAARSFILMHTLNKKEFYGQKIPKKIYDEKFGNLIIIDLTSNTQ